ncbi:MAG: ABC transporter ATP-binding protein [Magnetococcales bacterium]|nr:ABC transporter ATP-binding protein [Magnetococcales bacterium]
MITIHHLVHRYPGKRRHPPRLALESLSLDIPKGALMVLTGPNGSGKSTLFQILAGQLLPSEGSVQMGGIDIFRESRAARELMGVVFQKPALDKHLTIRENLTIHADLYHLNRQIFRQRLAEDLHWTGLQDRLDDRVETLSGGMARQVELVKALLHRPQILLMDEPTTGLDPGRRRAFLKTILKLKEEMGLTVLMTSHLFEEAEAADLAGILKEGRLIAFDTPFNLKKNLGREMVVIESHGVEVLMAALSGWEGITLEPHPGELRVLGVEATALLKALFADHREQINAFTIKDPTLEDLYIRLTHQPAASVDHQESSP